MYERLITEFAEQDLDGIVEYIAVKLANPPAAGLLLTTSKLVMEVSGVPSGCLVNARTRI